MSGNKQPQSTIARPKGLPRAEWASMNGQQKKSAAKKWHFAVNDLSMGSADAPAKKRSEKKSRSIISLNPRSQQNSQSGMQVQRIQQDELIHTVDGQSTFNCVSWQIQPGLATVFPWLSKISILFQKYRVHNIRFYLKTLVSPLATLGQQGRAILSFDSDSSSTLLTSLQQAEAMEPHADGLPCDNIVLVAPSGRVGPLWTRFGPVPSGTDIKLYDFGTLMLCTSGFGASGTFAELRVAYDIELMLPQLPSETRPTINFTASAFKSPVNTSLTTTVTVAVPLSLVGSVGNGLALDIPVSGSMFTMPQGLFEVCCRVGFSNSATSVTFRGVYVFINSVQITDYDCVESGTSIGGGTLLASFVYSFNAGDTLEFKMLSNFASGTCTAVGYMYATLA